jgi:hypothetical protein
MRLALLPDEELELNDNDRAPIRLRLAEGETRDLTLDVSAAE